VYVHLAGVIDLVDGNEFDDGVQGES
jgi:hypothetical protein